MSWNPIDNSSIAFNVPDVDAATAAKIFGNEVQRVPVFIDPLESCQPIFWLISGYYKGCSNFCHLKPDAKVKPARPMRLGLNELLGLCAQQFEDLFCERHVVLVIALDDFNVMHSEASLL